MLVVVYLYFFFSSRRRHTRLQGDWSSDVCSSDLAPAWRASRRAVAPGEWWRGGPHGLRRFPHARSRANRRTRDAAGPCRARMRGRARLVRPDAAPPRGPPAPDRVPRSRTRGTHRVVPPGPRGSRPPLRPGPNRARVRVARAPTPRETRAPQRGGEDRRSARCGREVPAAPRDPWFGDDQGGPRRGWIRYRDVARGSESMRNGECGMRNDTATLVAGNDPRLAIPHSALRIQELFLNLMLPFTVSSARRRPPLPIVPRRLRGPSRPVTMRGKSVWMSPLTVLVRTSVARPAGRSSVIPPLTVRNSSASLHVARPSEATISPFTVCASA